MPYGPTEDRVRGAYVDLLSTKDVSPGSLIVFNAPGNGGVDTKHKNRKRDTIIYIPSTLRADERIDVIFFFHGLGGFSERDFKIRILRHTQKFLSNNRNYIIVVPEMPWSKNTSTPRSRQGRVFLSPGDFPVFTDSIISRASAALNIKESNFILGSAILIGHSAGGSTLKSISKSGGLDWLHTTRRFRNVRIIFSDAGYGSWTQATWRSFKMRASSNTEFIFLTRRWDRPYNNTIKFLKGFREIPSNIVHKVFERKEATHTQIGDQALAWSYYKN